MNLNEKCCNALGCRSEIEKELDSLRKVVLAMSRDINKSSCIKIINNAFGFVAVELASVRVGDYYCGGDSICYVKNQFAADCINGYMLGSGEKVKVWRNENA